MATKQRRNGIDPFCAFTFTLNRNLEIILLSYRGGGEGSNGNGRGKRLAGEKNVGEMSTSKAWSTWHLIVGCARFDSSDDGKRDRESI